MNLGQSDFVEDDPGFFDLLSEPGAQLIEYQDTVPTAGATPSILQQLVEFGKAAIPAALSFQQQRDLNEINIERARKGLPPINTAQFMAQSAPQVRVGMTQDTQKMLMYGVLIAAAAGIIMVVARR